MAFKPLPSRERLFKLLSYNPKTGKLYAKPRSPEDFKASGSISAETRAKQWNAVWAGREAFTAISASGHRVGNIDKRTLLAHRVVWKLVHGEEPGLIDHINRDPTDNRIENLREVTRAQNLLNSPVRKDASSGMRGVKRSRNGARWYAKITQNGKTRHIGTFDCWAHAIAARRKAEREHFLA